MTGKTLVAGVGNIFQRDDAFGVEVIRLLADRPRSPGVKIADFGIRGVHLVYELLDGCDLCILVDVAQRGCAPGTVTVIEVEPTDMTSPSGVMDAHGLAPDQVFAMLDSLGSRPKRSLVVACEPADMGAGMGLSDQVRQALPHAVRTVEKILEVVDDQAKADPVPAIHMSSARVVPCQVGSGVPVAAGRHVTPNGQAPPAIRPRAVSTPSRQIPCC